MSSIDTPRELADALVGLFPSFSAELDEEDIATFHHVFFLLAPNLSHYLGSASEKALDTFCGYINSFVEAGGVKENAVSTCLLEHASQIGVLNLVRSGLSAAAKKELR